MGWVLLKKIEPSERTKKELNFKDKYEIWWHSETNELICDCPGFIFKGKCKHTKEWQEKLKGVVNLKNKSK